MQDTIRYRKDTKHERKPRQNGVCSCVQVSSLTNCVYASQLVFHEKTLVFPIKLIGPLEPNSPCKKMEQLHYQVHHRSRP